MDNNNTYINIQPVAGASDVPAAPAVVTAAVPAAAENTAAPVRGFDSQGREKRYMFIRKMNSVGSALLLDIMLQTMAALQVAIIAIVVLLLGSFISMGSLTSLMEGDFSGMTEMIMLCSILANAVAMPISHLLSGYIHSVRNDFTIGSVMGKAKWRGSGFWSATVLALGATYAWMFVYMLLGRLMPGTVFDNSVLTTSNFDGASTARMIVTALYVCIGAPITEEFLCRGVLLKSMSKYGVPFAVFASSLIFGLIHGNLFQTPFAILVGVVLGYVAVRSGSIWPGVIIHFIVNSFATARDMTMSLLPAEYRSVVLYCFYGIAGLLVLGSIIILCVGGRKIKWQPIDRESNGILLPEVKSKVRCKPLFMLLSVTMLIVIAIYVFNILFTSGVTFGMDELLPVQEIQELQ